MSEHRIFPHGLPEELAPGLWQVKGSLPFPLPRNMTVLRLPSGGLLIYSAVAMDEAGMKALEALGKPEIMVVPHHFHLMDAPFYKARYPQLKVVATDVIREKLGTKLVPDGRPEALLPAAGVRFHQVPGLKGSELVLDVDVPGGRALVFTDVFGTPLQGFMAKLLGAPGGTGVPRIVKLRQIADKPAVRRFLEELAEIPALQMILVSHGAPLREGCAAALKTAAQRL
ncbi:MAG: hypothetical protein U1E65_22580 [Myxococcota bacterium]